MRLAAEARDDLRDLLQYSLETWGWTERDAYRAAIQQRLASLAEYPELGRPRNDLFSGCRGLPIRQHVAYYLVEDAHVVVVRILHGRREPLGAVAAPKPR